MNHEVEVKGMEIEHWIGEGGRPRSTNYNPSKVYRVKRRSILHDLPYFTNRKIVFYNLFYATTCVACKKIYLHKTHVIA